MSAVNTLSLMGAPTVSETLTNNSIATTINGLMAGQYSFDFAYGQEVQAAISASFLLMGALMIFYGSRFFKATLFFLSLLFVAGLTYYIGVHDHRDQRMMLGIGLALGVFAGMLAIKLWKAALFSVGVAVGFVCWLTFLNIYPKLLTTQVALYTALAVPCVLLGMLSVYMEVYWLIFATPILGSFLVTQGTSYFANWNLNVFATLSGSASCSTSFCYAVYAGMVALALLGMFVQWEFTSSIAVRKTGGTGGTGGGGGGFSFFGSSGATRRATKSTSSKTLESDNPAIQRAISRSRKGRV